MIVIIMIVIMVVIAIVIMVRITIVMMMPVMIPVPVIVISLIIARFSTSRKDESKQQCSTCDLVIHVFIANNFYKHRLKIMPVVLLCINFKYLKCSRENCSSPPRHNDLVRNYAPGGCIRKKRSMRMD